MSDFVVIQMQTHISTAAKSSSGNYIKAIELRGFGSFSVKQNTKNKALYILFKDYYSKTLQNEDLV
jgi:hypothetical protein